jgi:hypothetical protein
VEVYVYNHIKHFDRKCPRIENISDEMLGRHKSDDVYETCRRCEKKNAGAQGPKF